MIGLIFGETDFPKKILKKIKNKKKYLIIDLTKRNRFRKEKNCYKVYLGQFGKIIKILKDNKCKKVLFAGKVKKPNLTKIRLDLKGLYYMPRIIKSVKIGDAAVLKEIINILKKEKIKTLSSLAFNPELALKKGNFTKVRPNKLDKKDIEKGILSLRNLNSYNYSQGVIVRNQKVVAIERKDGTEKMLKRCKKLKGNYLGILVKFPKKKQDLRIDLPTVGLKTLKQCKKSGLKGVVLKSNQNIFLEKNKCIKFANKNNMFILVI